MFCRDCGKICGASICVDCFLIQVQATPPTKPPYIKENRMGGDMIECGAIHALFEDISASEVGTTSGAQSAFDAAREFVKSMIQNQCELAGCLLAGQPYGAGDVHTAKCWYTKRAEFYRKRAEQAACQHESIMGSEFCLKCGAPF